MTNADLPETRLLRSLLCEQSRWFCWWPLLDVLRVGKATSRAQQTRRTNFKGVGGFFHMSIFLLKKKIKQEESHMRKRTIRQGQISQRRRSKIPFMEHTPETKRRKEERRASGEATIREDSSREEREGDKIKGSKKQEERMRDCIRRGHLRREHPEASQQYPRLTGKNCSLPRRHF